jgi:serine/threonine-protein kinase
LLAPIASGGMARVWMARLAGQKGFQRLVAIKLIRPEYASDPHLQRMFLDEARIASRIHHTNVVEVMDLAEQDGLAYQVMPLVHGASMSKLLAAAAARGMRLEPHVILRIVADAARGLHAAHELRDDDGKPLEIVHRDVSPHNVLVGEDGVSKIADFGIARALGRLASETNVGQIKGKVTYLSPEQIDRFVRGDLSPVDRRTDVFTAGIVLWEGLTGEPLFRASDPFEAMTKIRKQTIRDPRALVTGLRPEVSAIVMRALERDVEARYQTTEELADAIEATDQCGSAKDVASSVRELVGHDIDARRNGAGVELQKAVVPGPLATLGPGAADDLNARDSTPTALERSRAGTRTTTLAPLVAATAALAVGVAAGVLAVKARPSHAGASASVPTTPQTPVSSSAPTTAAPGPELPLVSSASAANAASSLPAANSASTTTARAHGRAAPPPLHHAPPAPTPTPTASATSRAYDPFGHQ